MLSWENQKLAYFLAGWCVIAPICGILRWRPHVWLTGGRGTGKTWILENIIEPCLRQICLSTQGKATEAGVRQGLDSDAWPVIHDEADAHGDRGHARISDLIELARLASSDTAPAIYKGSSHGTAKIYRVRSVFCFSSINPKLEESADRSRVTILTLKKSNDETAFKRLAVAAIQTINPTWVDGLISRSIHLAESIRRNAGSFAEVLAGHLGDRRTGDQLGALLAGAYSLTSNKTISIEVAEKWVSEHDFTEEALEIADTEPRECLNRLLQNVIRPLPATERSVSELLAISNLARKMPPGDIVDEPVSHIQADQTLRRLGVKWKKDRTGSTLGWIAIGQGYEGVKGIYEKTQWRASFSRVLKRLDNRVTEASSERFLYGDIKSRAVLIPWDICFDEESE
jgi:putative DNA primase/helicase